MLCVRQGTSAALEEPAQRLDDHVEQLREHGSYLGVRDLCIGKDNDTGGYESGASRFEIVTHSASYECRDDGALHFAAPPSTRIRWWHGKHAELALAQRPGKYCHYYARSKGKICALAARRLDHVRSELLRAIRNGTASGNAAVARVSTTPAARYLPYISDRKPRSKKYLVMRSIPIYYSITV